MVIEENTMIFNYLPIQNYRITSKFGKRNTGIKGASTNHKGIDLVGSPALYAVKDGVVVKNYWNNVRGWVVVINIGKDYEVLYQHLKSQSPLKINQEVSYGQVIGVMGNSSKTLKIAPHLHFEVHYKGTPIDPEPYIQHVEVEMTETEVRELVSSMLAGKDTEPSKWAVTDIEQAKADGISDGSRPKGYATREEVISMITRANRRK